MRISLCTAEYNTDGDVLINASETTDIAYLSRRLTRTATLDGGSVIIDNGFSPSDGNIKIKIDPSQNSLSLYTQITAMIKQFGLVTVSLSDGFFLAVIADVSNNQTNLTINLLIKSQLA